MERIIAIALMCGSLMACNGVPAPAQPNAANPDIVAKINYVCAYSGLF